MERAVLYLLELKHVGLAPARAVDLATIIAEVSDAGKGRKAGLELPWYGQS